MERESIKSKIISIIISNSALDESERPTLIEGLSLADDLRYDSVCYFSLIMELEEEFNISFEDTELLLDNLDDASNLIEMVIGLVSSKGRGLLY